MCKQNTLVLVIASQARHQLIQAACYKCRSSPAYLVCNCSFSRIDRQVLGTIDRPLGLSSEPGIEYGYQVFYNNNNNSNNGINQWPGSENDTRTISTSAVRRESRRTVGAATRSVRAPSRPGGECSGSRLLQPVPKCLSRPSKTAGVISVKFSPRECRRGVNEHPPVQRPARPNLWFPTLCGVILF